MGGVKVSGVFSLRIRERSLTYDNYRTNVFDMRKKSKTSGAGQLPTEAELEILNVLWAMGPSTVRDVHTLSGKATGYTTVLKQMQVMVEKGLLERSERFRSHVYEPRIAKDRTQQQLARNLVQRAFDGSAKELVLGALSSQKVSAAELAEIRQMLDEFERGAR
jgi:BlaI family transcriptional regulator, penicillinase repressor